MKNSNIYAGTYDSIIKHQELLNNYKFDCITVHNTLHGNNHDYEELINLFKFFKKYCKYLIITNPVSKNILKKFKTSDARFHRMFIHEIDNNLLTDDPFKLINDPSIDVIVEVMGGVDLAKDIISSIIKIR